MSLDPHRKQYLDAMGIDLWVSRDALEVEATPVITEEAVPRSVDQAQPVAQTVAPKAAATPSARSEASVQSRSPSKPKPSPTQPVIHESIAPEPPFDEGLPPVDTYDFVPPEDEDFDFDFGSVEPKPDGVATLSWDELAERVKSCQLCDLHKTRTQTVFGVGNPKADLMFIGEAPGQEEDRKGEPFVGKAGQLLDKMMQAIGFDRDQTYIANILKCRPPNNRDPQPQEVEPCFPYLKRQLAIIQPKVVVCLGRHAVHNLLDTTENLGRMRGKPHQIKGFDIPVIATYHPAYLLRNPRDKRKAWEDLLLVKQHLK